MDREKFLELTNKLYRTTLLFPKKEPLRYKIREVAGNILANFVVWEVFHSPNPTKFLTGEKERQEEIVFDIEKDLEILNSYFEVAKWQNWVSYFDIIDIQEEYGKIKREIQKEMREAETKKEEGYLEIKERTKSVEEINKQIEIEREEGENFVGQALPGKQELRKKQPSLDSRKEKILGFLKEKGRVQVWQVNKVFPEVSRRTLRRDFAYLLEQGIIERIGEKNNTFYQLRKQSA